MKVFILSVLMGISLYGYAQKNGADTALVKENYFGTPLAKVLNDFETKYGMRLKYDSALVSGYLYDYLYLGVERLFAFDIIFRENKDLSYYIDEEGVYCIVARKNLPKNRTKLENKRYEGGGYTAQTDRYWAYKRPEQRGVSAFCHRASGRASHHCRQHQ